MHSPARLVTGEQVYTQSPRCPRHAGRCAGRQSGGFTLLEVLVTLVILGVLLATLSQGLEFGLRAWSMEGLAGTRVSGMEATDRALRQLIERCNPEPDSARPPMAGSAHILSFVTTLPEGLGAVATHEADVTLLAKRGHLALLWRPHYGRWIVTPPPRNTIDLLDGVSRLDVSYWGGGTDPARGRWLSAWSGRQLPRLIRLHIVLAAGDAQHWPDIVVAPMRDTPLP